MACLAGEVFSIFSLLCPKMPGDALQFPASERNFIIKTTFASPAPLPYRKIIGRRTTKYLFSINVCICKKIVIISKYTGCCFYCGNAGINSAFFYWIYGSGNQPMRSQNLSTLLQHLQHLPAITAEKDAWPSWLISGEASFNILTLNISKFHAETRVLITP